MIEKKNLGLRNCMLGKYSVKDVLMRRGLSFTCISWTLLPMAIFSRRYYDIVPIDMFHDSSIESVYVNSTAFNEMYRAQPKLMFPVRRVMTVVLV